MTDKSLPLSARKNKKKPSKSIQNVLAVPTDPFWPVLLSSDAVCFLEELERCLRSAKVEKLDVACAKDQHLFKEDRKYLLFGVNSVTKGIENGDVACCILAEEATPNILVKHIATLAYHSKVPVLVVPQLKAATKNSIGFSCLALAFKKSVSLDRNNVFFEMCQSISQKAKAFCAEDPCSSPCLIEDVDALMMSLGTFITRKKFTVKEVDISKIHLVRESNNDRIFKPKSLILPGQEKSDIVEEQFISLNFGGNSLGPVKLKKCITSLRQNNKTLIKDKTIKVLSTNNEMDVDSLVTIDTNLSTSDSKYSHNSDRENTLYRSYKHTKVLRVQSNPDKIRKKKDKLKFNKLK